MQPILFLSCSVLSIQAFAADPDERFNLANGVFTVGDYSNALRYYDQILQDAPDYKHADEALFRKGECLYRLKEYPRAAESFQSLLAKYPAFKEANTARYRLGEIYFTHLKNYDKAAESYGRLVETDPKHKLADSSLYFHGESLFKLKEYDKAIAACRRLMTDYPDSEYAGPACYSLGWSHFLKEDHPRAIEAFDTVLTRYPNHPSAIECQLRKAESLFAIRKFDEARSTYQIVVDKSPGEFRDQASIGVGRCLFDLGRKADAAQVFLKTADQFPKSPSAPVALYNAGSALFGLEQAEQALAAFDRLLKDYPACDMAKNAAYWRGRTLLRLSRPEEARQQFESLAREKEGVDAAGVAYGLGDAHYAANRHAEAARQYESVLQKFPKHDLADDAAYGLCLCLDKLGQPDRGVEVASQALTQFPQSPHAAAVRFLLGEFHARKGNHAQAIPEYEKVAALGGDLADDALYKLGWSQRLAQQAAAARTTFRKLAATFEKSPFTPEAKFLEGKIADEQDEPEEAIRILDSVTRSWPESSYGDKAAFAAALVHYQRNQFPPASQRLEKFLTDFPRSDLVPPALLHLGESAFAMKQIDKASATFARILKEFPNHPVAGAALYGQAWCLRDTKKLDEAAAEFTRMATAYPKHDLAAESLYWAGMCLSEAARFEPAMGLFQRLLQNHPTSNFIEESTYRIATCQFGLKQFGPALEAYEKFLQAYPKSEWVPHVCYDLGWCYKERKDTEKMRAAYERVVRDFPKAEVLAEASFALGEIDYEAQAYESAERHYSRAVQAGKASVLDRALYKLAWSQSQQQKAPESLATYRRLIEELPASPFCAEACYRMGRMHQDRKSHDLAVQAFEKSLGKDKSGPFAELATFQLAESYRELQDWAKALACYGQVVEKFPNSKYINEALYGAGLCSMEVGALKDAEEAFAKVVKQTETVTAARAQLALGEIRFRQGKFEEAAEQFLKVHFLYGYEEWKPPAVFLAAQSFAKLNKPDQAKLYYELVKTKFPQSEYAKKAQAALDAMK